MVGAAVVVLACAACSSSDPTNGDSGVLVLSDGGPINPMGGDAGECQPADVSTFQAPSYRPAIAQPGRCTTKQIDDFFRSCIAQGTTTDTCAHFLAADAGALDQTCAACLLTRQSDTRYGALVRRSATVTLNVSGCLELTTGADPKALVCAKSFQASEACDDQACKDNCAVTSTAASFAAYSACTAQAAKSGCQSFTQAATCTMDYFAGPASRCFSGADFQAVYTSIAELFCGPSMNDAGAREAGAGEAGPADGGGASDAASGG